MIDLDEQLRDYIDGIASPIPSPAHLDSDVTSSHLVRSVHRRRRPRIAGAVLVAILAAVVVAVLIVRLADHGTESAPPSIAPPSVVTPEGPARAFPLTVRGTADCSSLQVPGDTLTFSGIVNGGHSICVVTRDNHFSAYFDGREISNGGLSSGTIAPGGEWWTGSDVDGERTLLFGGSRPFNASEPPEGWRALFCDGRSVDTRPLGIGPTYFFGFEYDTALGTPNVISLIDGKPAGGTYDDNCPPPSTASGASSQTP